MTALPVLPAELARGGPDPRILDAACGVCDVQRCVPVATVSWVEDGYEEPLLAGLACLPAAVDQARERHQGSRQVTVVYPTWGSDDLRADAGLTARRVEHWVRLGLIVPMDGRRPGSGYVHAFLACEAEHARWLARLSGCGLNLHRAHELLVGSEADRAMALALWRRLGDRGAVAA